MSENRKNSRRVCVVPVEGKKNSLFDHTQVIDFSKGGIGFISRHRIPLNKEVPIEIELTAEGEPVLVMGRVQWVQRIVDSGHYRVGVSFNKDVLQGSRSRLSEYFKDSQEG